MNKPILPVDHISKLPLSRGKILAFKLIAILLPLIFIILLEIVLRLAHYGHDLHLFVEAKDDKQSWVMNQYVSQKYFTKKENATIGIAEPFAKIKSANTFRIFVLGESTTQGFPYNHNGSFHRWLKYRLMQTFPDKNFEIINLSLTAVNSTTVYDFSKEVIHYQPDAVLIYVGHNEYYGALGVGSTSNIGNNMAIIRLKLKLKPLRIVQLLTNTIHKIQMVFTKKSKATPEQLMQRMAADQHIRFASDSYQQGIHQFEQNLNDICRIFSKNNIPLFVSNLVSNEKDLPPFISDSSSKASSALYQYNLAQKAYANEDYKTAKIKFVLAKELDMLRFRAPEALNSNIEIITHSYPCVHFVDTRTAFETHSPHGIIGKETILEHVHPNLFGYAILSDAFFTAMQQQHLIEVDWNHPITFDQLLIQMPVLRVDSLRGAKMIQWMMQDWPFHQTKKEIPVGNSFEDTIAHQTMIGKISWNNALDTLLNHYIKRKDWHNALKTAESAVLEYPQHIDGYTTAAKMCQKLQDLNRMLFYLQKAFILEPTTDKALSVIALCMRTDQPEKALPCVMYMTENGNAKADFTKAKEIILRLEKIKEILKTDSTNLNLLNSVAAAYCFLQNKPVATRYLSKVFVLDPFNKQALEIKQKLAAMSDSIVQIH